MEVYTGLPAWDRPIANYVCWSKWKKNASYQGEILINKGISTIWRETEPKISEQQTTENWAHKKTFFFVSQDIFWFFEPLWDFSFFPKQKRGKVHLTHNTNRSEAAWTYQLTINYNSIKILFAFWKTQKYLLWAFPKIWNPYCRPVIWVASMLCADVH